MTMYTPKEAFELLTDEQLKLFTKPDYTHIHPDIKVEGPFRVTFDDIYIDDTFGNVENDPRLFGNSAIITKNKSYIDQGVFTTCKKRGDKCPPWKLVAEKVIHDKEKQTVNYENAKLYFCLRSSLLT